MLRRVPGQLIQGDAEEVGQLDEFIQIGHRLARLPLADALAGHPQLFRQLLLGQTHLGAESENSFGQGHVGFLPLFQA